MHSCLLPEGFRPHKHNIVLVFFICVPACVSRLLFPRCLFPFKTKANICWGTGAAGMDVLYRRIQLSARQIIFHHVLMNSLLVRPRETAVSSWTLPLRRSPPFRDIVLKLHVEVTLSGACWSCLPPWCEVSLQDWSPQKQIFCTARWCSQHWPQEKWDGRRLSLNLKALL